MTGEELVLEPADVVNFVDFSQVSVGQSQELPELVVGGGLLSGKHHQHSVCGVSEDSDGFAVENALRSQSSMVMEGDYPFVRGPLVGIGPAGALQSLLL